MDVTDLSEILPKRELAERLGGRLILEEYGKTALGAIAKRTGVNNILTVIMGSASSALEQCPSCEHSQAVLSASKRAAYLTKQLLNSVHWRRTISAVYFLRLVSTTRVSYLKHISASIPGSERGGSTQLMAQVAPRCAG